MSNQFYAFVMYFFFQMKIHIRSYVYIYRNIAIFDFSAFSYKETVWSQ